MNHDICYRDNDTRKRKLICDDEMLKELDELKPENVREKIDKQIVKRIIKGERKICLPLNSINNRYYSNLFTHRFFYLCK